jgi:hypothetical protein
MRRWVRSVGEEVGEKAYEEKRRKGGNYL